MTERLIGLLGATGYTGRLVAQELVRRGLPVRLGARSPDRLTTVALLDGGERRTVDTTDPRQLAEFLSGLDVVINTVGPFTALGPPVVRAAVEAGVRYVDSTGEFDYMAQVYDDHANAPVSVVPACGFDYVPGDCAAYLAVDSLGVPAREVAVRYRLSGMRPSRGTVRTALEGVIAVPGARPRIAQLRGGAAVQVPWGEDVTVPRWAPGVPVRVTLRVAAPVALAAGVTGPVTQPLLRLAAPVLRRAVDRLPDGPSERRRAAAAAEVTATATGHDGRTATVEVTVRDVYAFTALALVEYALRVDRPGALTPAQAVDPATVLDALSGSMLQWRRGGT